MIVIQIFFEYEDETYVCTCDSMEVALASVERTLRRLDRKWSRRKNGPHTDYHDSTYFSSDPEATSLHARITENVYHVTKPELLLSVDDSID